MFQLIKINSLKLGDLTPVNCLSDRLGNFLKELDLTEGRATGIPIIRKALQENGSPVAYFDTDEDRSFFETTLAIHPVFKSGAKSGAKPVQKTSAKLTPKQQEILEIIKANPKISYREVAQKLDISNSTAQEHFNNLKKKGVIKRVGPARGGYWEVVQED